MMKDLPITNKHKWKLNHSFRLGILYRKDPLEYFLQIPKTNTTTHYRLKKLIDNAVVTEGIEIKWNYIRK